MFNQSPCQCGCVESAVRASDKQIAGETCACSPSCQCGEACACTAADRCAASCDCA